MAAPFRIRSSQGIKPATEATNIQSYMDKLIKLIPAEVIAIYLTGKGFFDPNLSNDLKIIGIWSWVCLLLVIIIRIWGTRDISNPTKKIQWPAVVISAISFLIWVYAVTGNFLGINFDNPKIVSLVILVWTFIIPIFYKGD